MGSSIAIYPGSFDPPTFGHMDIIERAAKVFEKLIVTVAWNSAKTGLFTPDERVEMLREETRGIENVEVSKFNGLTVDYARERGAIAVIRGLRAVSDFEYELAMAATNRHLNPDCDTVSFMPSEQFMFISSRLVKEIASLKGDVSHFVSPQVVQRLKEKFHHS